MATLSELMTTLKGKMLPLEGGTLTGALTAPSVSITNDNAKVNGKNIVRSVNGTVAGTDGNVDLTYYRQEGSSITKDSPDFQFNTGKSITLETLDSSNISYVKVMLLTVASATVTELNGWVWKNGYVPTVTANDTLVACRIGNYAFLQAL